MEQHVSVLLVAAITVWYLLTDLIDHPSLTMSGRKRGLTMVCSEPCRPYRISSPLPKVLVRSPGCVSSGSVGVLRVDMPRCLQVGIVRVGALWMYRAVVSAWLACPTAVVVVSVRMRTPCFQVLSAASTDPLFDCPLPSVETVFQGARIYNVRPGLKPF